MLAQNLLVFDDAGRVIRNTAVVGAVAGDDQFLAAAVAQTISSRRGTNCDIVTIQCTAGDDLPSLRTEAAELVEGASVLFVRNIVMVNGSMEDRNKKFIELLTGHGAKEVHSRNVWWTKETLEKYQPQY